MGTEGRRVYITGAQCEGGRVGSDTHLPKEVCAVLHESVAVDGEFLGEGHLQAVPCVEGH